MSLLVVVAVSLFMRVYGDIGVATVYGTGDGGNCGWGDVPTSTFPYANIVAIGSDWWNNGLGCGQCFSVRCISGSNTNNCPIKTCKDVSVIVQAVDQCPECSNTHLDLSTSAWNTITQSSGCILDIEFDPIACPGEIGDIIIEGKGGSSKWHLEVFAKRMLYPVINMAVRDDRNTWYPCQHTNGQGFFLCNGGKPYQGNVDVRVTGSNGETISTNNIFTNENFVGDRNFGKNFASAPTSPSSPTAPSPTVAVTPKPTTSTTKQPTSSSGNAMIKMGASGNPIYYLVLFVEGFACGSLESVEFQDKGSYQNYYLYTDRYGCCEFQFNNNGNPFRTPAKLRITNTNGQVIETDYIINNFDEGKTFDIGTNFCQDGNTPKPTPQPTTPAPTSSKVPTTAYPTTPGSNGETCIPAPGLKWESKNHQLYLNNVLFNMKGVSWFGFDTDTFIVHGLASWANGGLSYIAILDFLADNGFNAIRLPFSQNAILNNPIIDSSQHNGGGSDNNIFSGKRVLDAMDIVINAAGDRGILIMLDLHCVNPGGHLDGFDQLGNNWENTAGRVWTILANRYRNTWNIFMADIYNEPYDIPNNQWGNWINYAQYIGELLIEKNVNWLILVQGTNSDCGGVGGDCSGTGYCNWGENLRQLGCGPNKQKLSLSEPNRVVYSPHVYGQSIGGNAYGADVWEKRWGFIANSNDILSAVVIGEYGTTLGGSDLDWLTQLIAYLKQINQRNTFFWCFNTNSGDTGGLIKSWDLNQPETLKLDFLEDLQPNPSQISYNQVTGNVCLSGQQTPEPTSIGSEPPTPEPTTKRPTTQPTYPLTVCPTIYSSNNRRRLSSTNVVIENKGPQLWWIQYAVHNIDCGSIKKAFIKDSKTYSSWYASTAIHGCCEFEFQPNSGAYTYPISIKLVNTNGNKIIVNNLFKNLDDILHDTNTNFCSGGSTTLEPTTTIQPTQIALPTPQPTPLSNNNNGLIIKMGSSGNVEWFISLSIGNIACGSIITVEYSDNTNYGNWYEHTATYNGNEFQFNNNGQSFNPPGSLRLTNSNNEILVINNILTDYNEGETYNTGVNFCTNGETPNPTVSTTKSPTKTITNSPTVKPSIKPTQSPTTVTDTKSPTSNPTTLPTRARTYSITFTVDLSISTSSSLPDSSTLEEYANDVTILIFQLDNTYYVESNVMTATSTLLSFKITVYLDLDICKEAIEDFIYIGTTFESDFTTQYQSKLNNGNSDIIIQQNAGIEILYDKVDDNNNTAFWKKVTNILLIIICSLIGVLCIITIAFCVFCRVHSKKMREKIRKSVTRRFSSQPNKTKSKSNSNDDDSNDNINDGMIVTTNNNSTQAIVANEMDDY